MKWKYFYCHNLYTTVNELLLYSHIAVHISLYRREKPNEYWHHKICSRKYRSLYPWTWHSSGKKSESSASFNSDTYIQRLAKKKTLLINTHKWVCRSSGKFVIFSNFFHWLRTMNVFPSIWPDLSHISWYSCRRLLIFYECLSEIPTIIFNTIYIMFGF